MKFIVAILTIFVAVFIADRIKGRELRNDYKAIGIFGKPGTGKSTLIQKMMYEHIKKGWTVYYDAESSIPGVIHFDGEDFKKGNWLPDGRKEPRGIAIFFDEFGILYNNREFKTNFIPKTMAWWKLHRHYKVRVIYASQSFKDMDLKVRQLTQELYLMKQGLFLTFKVAKHINVKFDIQNNESGDDTGGQIVEKFEYDLPFFHKYIFLPKWIKVFDSYRT